MIEYFYDYGAFLLGAALHVLGKLQDFKQMAKSQPNQNVKVSLMAMASDEWINFARLLIGGVALVIFTPKMIGGTMVEIKNIAGQVVSTIEMKTMLLPFYFLIGMAGNSALFAYFGKYKKTLFNQVGVDSTN